jgi:hypothetical protein
LINFDEMKKRSNSNDFGRGLVWFGNENPNNGDGGGEKAFEEGNKISNQAVVSISRKIR